MSEHSPPASTGVDICGEALGAVGALDHLPVESSLTDCSWCSTCGKELSKIVREK